MEKTLKNGEILKRLDKLNLKGLETKEIIKKLSTDKVLMGEFIKAIKDRLINEKLIKKTRNEKKIKEISEDLLREKLRKSELDLNKLELELTELEKKKLVKDTRKEKEFTEDLSPQAFVPYDCIVPITFELDKLNKEKLNMEKQHFKVGDKVKITDGRYAVRLSHIVCRSFIGKSKDVFEVIQIINDNLTSRAGTQVHDVIIRNTYTQSTYLHSQAMIKLVKPEVDPGFIKALKLSIRQWKIMADTGKSKRQTYEFLTDKKTVRNDPLCLLCDFICPAPDKLSQDCKKCINWGKGEKIPCWKEASVFSSWSRNKSQSNTRAVWSHLKSELVSLESKSK